MGDIEITLDEYLERGKHSIENVMISGRTGIGKTARIMAWAEEYEDINFVTFDAALMGITEIDGHRLLFSTDEVDRMDMENTVVFVDNYHWIRPEVEAELNLFFDERKVADLREESGYRTLKNIIFAVVAYTEQPRI